VIKFEGAGSHLLDHLLNLDAVAILTKGARVVTPITEILIHNYSGLKNIDVRLQ